MTIELVKDILKVEELKGKNEVQVLVETEIYLNQTKASLEKILWTDGKVEIMNTKIVKDKMVVSGIVNFNIVYKTKEENIPIETVETTSDFREEIEMSDIDEEMMGKVSARIEHIEYDEVDERKIVLEALINIEARVENTKTIEIVKDIKGGEGLEVLKEKIRYNCLLGSSDSYAVVRDAFELRGTLPDIEEVLKLDLTSYEVESKVVEDRIIVSGIVEASFVYYGGGKLNSLKREVAFNHFVDIEGAKKDSNCQLKLEVVNGEYEIKEDLEGKLRVLDLEAKVKVAGKVYEQKQKEIVLDAYSTKKKINIQNEEIEVIENVKDIHQKETIKGKLKGMGFGEIYHIEGNPILIDSKIIEDKIILEGLISLKLLYLETGVKEIKTIKEEIPFKTYIESEGIDETMSPLVELILEDINYKIIDEQSIEVEANIDNFIFLNRQRKVNIVLDLEETDGLVDKSKRPSITVYIVQKGDSLWDIARRYNTTVEEIVLSNNIVSPDHLMPGEKIIIEKIVDNSF